jgi:hypothetical protein
VLLFIDESGRVSVDDVFAVGLLIVKNPDWLKEIVRSVRADFNYEGEFHLVKIHGRSFPAYQALITRIFEHFDKPRARKHIRFRTICVLGKTGIRRYEEHIAYNYYVEWALRHNLNKDMQGAVLYVDQKSRYDKDNLLKRLKTVADVHKPGAVKKVEELSSHKSDFLQVCDVLTGIVRFGNLLEHRLISRASLTSSRAQMKQTLWSFLKNYYGKGQPVSCHQIKSGNFAELQERYELLEAF